MRPCQVHLGAEEVEVSKTSCNLQIEVSRRIEAGGIPAPSFQFPNVEITSVVANAAQRKAVEVPP